MLRDAFFQQIFERLCQKNIDLSQVFVFGSQHRPWLTSAMTSDTTVAHLADSASGPSACPRNREIHASKVQKWFRGAFLRFGRLRLGTVSEFTVLIQCCGLRVNYSPGPSMPLWTFRRGFLPTPVGRQLVFLTSTDKGVGQRGWRARGGAEIKIVRCVSEDPDILDDP